ncbi:MAG: matrixin family metalloprotease [Acidobacteria bacterium]|nr:matrixin family metalloprotease [Acidobacteriota bacterium]
MASHKTGSKKSAGKKSAASGSPVRICFDRIIPHDYAPARTTSLKAAAQSFGRGPIGHLDATAGVIPAPHIAVVLGKKWPTGATLKCRFIDQANASTFMKKKVEQKAHIWEKYANVKFKFVTSGDADIRISFFADPGSWSAIGTDALVQAYFPKYQPTMNFGWLRDGTDDAEYERVVVHEFGHALGCIHEHQQPNAHLDWNTDAVYKYFSGPPNYWSKDDIDSNVLETYGPQGIGMTIFDPKSIMLYQFDGALFKNGKGTPENTHLSPLDEQFIAQMYPKKK